MKLSEAIEVMKKILEEHGDLPLRTYNDYDMCEVDVAPFFRQGYRSVGRGDYPDAVDFAPEAL